MKKWIILFCSVLLIILLSLGIYLNVRITDFMDARGVHIWGECAHINLQKKCFIVSTDTGLSPEISSETTFTISGIIQPLKESGSLNSFTGFMNVEAYPMPFEAAYTSTVGGITETFIEIRNQSVYFFAPECDTWYNVLMLKSNPDVIVIYIFLEDRSLIAACGETREEALENYQRYCDKTKELAEAQNTE